MFKKTIISEFFTTISFKQALDSLYLMTFGIFKLKNGSYNGKLIDLLTNKIFIKNTFDYEVFTLYNGRSAIYHALKIIGVKKNNEIIVSSYTCSVVINAVIQSGGNIKYSDIENETLSFDFKVLKKNITQNTKVIILQHTFGKQARDYEKIIKLAKEKNIIVIEDCAHSLGSFKNFKGDFLIFSTGRDKVISSVTGGILVINNEKYFGKKINQKHPSVKVILQNLIYNIIGYKSYKLYDFLKLGRIIIFISRKLNLISEILNKQEKEFNYNKFNLTLADSLAYLAVNELKNLDKYTKKRLENSKYYLENIDNKNIEIIFKKLKNYNGFRFPILLKSEKEKNRLIKFGRDNNIVFGTQWSGSNIIPVGIDFKKAGYIIGSCQVAEDISKRILTLPNHKYIEQKDMERIIKLINNF